MSSMISDGPERLSRKSFPARHQDVAGLVRHPLRRLGAGAVILATLSLLFAWSFIGALLMGLQTPATSPPRPAMLWLAVAVAIVLGGFVTELLVMARLKG